MIRKLLLIFLFFPSLTLAQNYRPLICTDNAAQTCNATRMVIPVGGLTCSGSTATLNFVTSSSGDTNYIRNDGTGTRTATIPFQQGLSVGNQTLTDSSGLNIAGLDQSDGAAETNVKIQDTTSMVAGVGGGVEFTGSDGVTPTRGFGFIQGAKENGTSGNYASKLIMGTRANGGNLTTRLTISSTGLVTIPGNLTVSGATTQLGSNAYTTLNTLDDGSGNMAATASLTAGGFSFLVDGSGNTTSLSYSLSDAADKNVDFESYAAGTAYTLTASQAQIAFGTTSPVFAPTKTGKYLVHYQVHCGCSGATFNPAPTLTIKLRRTNNTAADIANSSITVNGQKLIGSTFDLGNICGEVDYTTANTNDTIQLWGALSATPSLGSCTCDTGNTIGMRLHS